MPVDVNSHDEESPCCCNSLALCNVPNTGSSNELCSSLAIVPNKFTVLFSSADIEQNNFEIITQ